MKEAKSRQISRYWPPLAHEDALLCPDDQKRYKQQHTITHTILHETHCTSLSVDCFVAFYGKVTKIA